MVLSKDYADILALTCTIRLPHMVTQNLVKAPRKSCLYIQVQAYTHLSNSMLPQEQLVASHKSNLGTQDLVDTELSCMIHQLMKGAIDTYHLCTRDPHRIRIHKCIHHHFQ